MGFHDYRGSNRFDEVKSLYKSIRVSKPEHLDEFVLTKEQMDVIHQANAFPKKIFHSRRIYNSNEFVDQGVLGEHLKDHIWYNVTMRFGTAFIVEGVCFNTGYLEEERVTKQIEEIKRLEIKFNSVQIPYR